MMLAEDVLSVIQMLANSNIDVWLDGGWGVDALAEFESRPHDDLDVVIALVQASAAQSILELHGFSVSEDERPTRFVMQDGKGRKVDFHPVTFDEGGGGVQILQNGRRFRYPPEGFNSTGKIVSFEVRCLSPEVQMLCHTGYDPDENDRHDVMLLHQRFGIPLPEIYQEN